MMPVQSIVRTAIFALLISIGVTGCAGMSDISPQSKPWVQLPEFLGPMEQVSGVDARCVPPKGWSADPIKTSDRHTHQVWLSPTRDTAYGVIYFSLPLPVGPNIVHWEFLRQMKRTTGEANEISKAEDPNLPGLRFVCEGGHYLMRVNLIVSGLHGWAIYAGTIRQHQINEMELGQAEAAREYTLPGQTESTAINNP